MTASTLNKAEIATYKAVEASKLRDELIRQAHAEGSSLRAIAEVTGLSFQRVHQIVQGK